jgi:hypothetical protein
MGGFVSRPILYDLDDFDPLQVAKARGMRDLITVTSQSVRHDLTRPDGVAHSYLSVDQPLPLKELGFIKRVKDHARSVANRFQSEHRDGSIYSEARTTLFKTRFPVMWISEIDLQAAYWHAALAVGVINQAIFADGLQVSKHCRLVCLGALATRKEIWEYDPKKGGDPVLIDEVNSTETEKCWFAITRHLGEVMGDLRAAAGDGWLFWWVDQIYLANEDAEKKVLEALALKSLPYTVERPWAVDCSPRDGRLTIYDTFDQWSDRKGGRTFPVFARKNKTW